MLYLSSLLVHCLLGSLPLIQHQAHSLFLHEVVKKLVQSHNCPLCWKHCTLPLAELELDSCNVLVIVEPFGFVLYGVVEQASCSHTSCVSSLSW